MPVDTSIYQNLLRPKSVQEYSAEMDSAEVNRNALEANRMNLLAAKQAQADEQAVRAAYQRPGFDPQSDQGIADLYRLSPKAGMAAAKARQDALKAAADLGHVNAQTDSQRATAQKTTTEAAGTRLKQYRDTLDFVDTPQGAARWLAAQFQDPLTRDQMSSMGSIEDAIKRIPQDPVGFQQWRQQAALGMEKHMAEMRQQGVADATAKHQANQDRTAAGNLALRGAELSKPFEVTDPDGSPVLVRQDKQGNITPVQGYMPKGKDSSKPLAQPVTKQLTEARDNAATIDRLATSFEDKFASKGVLGLGADASMMAKGVLGADTKAVEWWKNYRKQAELIERHALFGAALTPTEQASWTSADIGPGMDAGVIKTNLATRKALTKKIFENTTQDLIDAGHSEKRIRAIAGRNTEVGGGATGEFDAPGDIRSQADAILRGGK